MTIDDLTLPVKTKFIMGQGFHGYTSHKEFHFEDCKVDDTYSLDFIIKEGTPLFAAKSGIIDDFRLDHTKNYEGSDANEARKFQPNYIVIDHDDGTYSVYVHLMKNGIVLNKEGEMLKKGDKVDQNQLIGYSGNTGWSTTPHLHFEVGKHDKEWFRKSIPFSFKDYDGPLEDREINPKYY